MIQGCLIVILVSAQLWLTNQFDQQVQNAAIERAKQAADGVINGLNTLMVTKVGKHEVIRDKTARSLFIQKMGASEKIKEMRVIRGKQTDSEFSGGLPQEQPIDDIDRNVLATGKPGSRLTLGKEGEASLRTVVPFIASKNFRTINCLECHSVPEGTVLGAASITIDVKDDLAAIKKINTWMWFGQGILQIIIYFVIGHIVRRLSRLLGGEPAYVIDIVKQIAKGNLSQQIATHPGDSTSLLAAIKHMRDERKQAEDALDEQRGQLADIISFLPDATLAIDMGKRVIIWNKAIENMTGIPASEMLGKGDHVCTIPFYGEALPHLMDLVFLDNSAIAARYPTINREGDVITAEVFCNALYNNKGAWVFAKASPLHDRSGKVIGAIEIIRDITERKQAEQELKRTQDEKREFAILAQSLRERERSSIARELHDELGQALTVLKMDVKWILDRMTAGQEPLAGKLDRMLTILDGTATATRRISSNLRPLILDDLGLIPAAEWLVENFMEHNDIDCQLVIADSCLDLPEPYTTTVFRILQESLTNVLRHAQASRVDISISLGDGEVRLTVRDNGRGFARTDPRKANSYGLMGLRERATLLDGEVYIDSAPGRGTVINVRIPITRCAVEYQDFRA